MSPTKRLAVPALRFRPRLEALEDRCVLSGGVLDPTFGSGGMLATDVAGPQPNQANAVAVYQNAGTDYGKIVAAGYCYSHGYQFTVIRYNLDGSLDSSFGGSGEVLGPSGSAHDVKIQADGKIVVAGWSGNDFAVARYNDNGTLDTTFGGNGGKGGKAGRGVVTTDFGRTEGAARLIIQPDGKIVVAGWASQANSTVNCDLALARYNADGSLDATFGTGGKATQHFAQPMYQQNGLSSTIDMAYDTGTGKIVVVAQPGHGTAVRFNTNGSLDITFGGGAGYVTLTNLYAIAVATQPDGRIVLGGPPNGAAGLGLTRLNTDGTPDTTFGMGGLVLTPVPGGNRVRSLTIQPDGKIVAAGTYDWNFIVARYNAADGSLDTSFGVNGVAVSGELEGSNSPGKSIGWEQVDVALEPDGRIVVVGSAYTATGSYEFGLARFLVARPQISSFTAIPDPATAGLVALTASGVVPLNPGSTVTDVAFYVDSNGDGVLDAGDAPLGSGTQTGTGTWTCTFSTTGWASGSYTLFAQAEDSYGAFSDPLALTLQVP